jgi:PTH2 family peptidyl-tRNA hydrolase
MNTKQVLVLRKDLNMRRGKECAQASHASIAFLRHRILHIAKQSVDENGDTRFDGLALDPIELDWLANGQTKICVTVKSEQELVELFDKVSEAGLTVHMITDSGFTEFHGVPTKTALCIGPAESAEIDKFTGHLKLH